MDNIYRQPLIPALQFEQQQPVYISAQQPGWEAMQMANVEYYNSINLLHERADVDIKKYLVRLKLQEETTTHMLKVREDIQIQRDLLEETVIITEGGELIRKQQFLLERPKEYAWANFRLVNRPIKYVSHDANQAVLFIDVLTQNQEKRVVYLDIERDEPGYFWRKFRKANLCFKRKRGEPRTTIFEIVQAVTNLAEDVELPSERGFYVARDGVLHYAGKDNLIWTEVKAYAE